MADNNQESVLNYIGRILGIGSQPTAQQSQPANVQAPQAATSAVSTDASMTQDEQRRAREEEARIVAEAGMAAPSAPSAAPLQQGVRSPGGLGMVDIKPSTEEMYVFPEESRRKEYEDSTKKRMQANTMIAFMLADPKYQRLPAHVREADGVALRALLDQEIPPVKSFNEDFPEVKDLAKSIEAPYRRRINAVAELSGQINRINDVFNKYGKNSKQATEILVPELMGMLKIYNTALSGTSDALSQSEVNRLSPELNPNIFDLTKATKLGGKVVGSNVEAFKRKLESLHDILIGESNMAWNTLAVQSSPEFANSRLGVQFARPYSSSAAARFEGKIPKRVATGALAYSEHIKQQEAKFADLLPKAEQTKATILSSQLSTEEKRNRLQELNKRFNAVTGREIQLPDEFLIPTGK